MHYFDHVLVLVAASIDLICALNSENTPCCDPNAANTNKPFVGGSISNQFQIEFNRNLSATDLTYSARAAFGFPQNWSNIMTFVPSSGWQTNAPGSTIIESAPVGSPPDQHVQVIITDPVDPTSTNRFFQLTIHQ